MNSYSQARQCHLYERAKVQHIIGKYSCSVTGTRHRKYHYQLIMHQKIAHVSHLIHQVIRLGWTNSKSSWNGRTTWAEEEGTHGWQFSQIPMIATMLHDSSPSARSWGHINIHGLPLYMPVKNTVMTLWSHRLWMNSVRRSQLLLLSAKSKGIARS